MAHDHLHVEINDDGTVKITTDAVSAANHSNAEQALAFISRLMGGESTRVRRSDAVAHHHHHEHEGADHHG